ncbi:hypothetical protein HHX47_DHR6000114 [Lentinula edodes]|nr:hypothetical protein HHX47_DHR6000114 [Lentinula edodes]
MADASSERIQKAHVCGYNLHMVKPTAHISDETHLLAGADMIFSISDFCSQLILIYRCYLVWSRNPWVVVLPILISCASVGKLLRYLFPIPNHLCLGLACGIGLIGLVLTISPNAPQAPAAIVPIGTAAFSMSLCLNFIVSALIVGRIWYITGLNREIKTDSAIRRASAIIIESGLLFLAAQLVFVVLFAIKHPAQAIVEPIATQIYGISPTLIIVRVGMGSTFEPTALPESSLRFRVTLGRKTKSTTTGTSRMTATTGSATDVEMGRLPSESSFVKSRNDE